MHGKTGLCGVLFFQNGSSRWNHMIFFLFFWLWIPRSSYIMFTFSAQAPVTISPMDKYFSRSYHEMTAINHWNTEEKCWTAQATFWHVCVGSWDVLCLAAGMQMCRLITTQPEAVAPNSKLIFLGWEECDHDIVKRGLWVELRESLCVNQQRPLVEGQIGGFWGHSWYGSDSNSKPALFLQF